MWAYILENTVQSVFRGFTKSGMDITAPDGTTTHYKWFQLQAMSVEELAALGILPYSETVPDQRYYYTDTNSVTYDIGETSVTATYTGIAKNVDALKTSMKAQVKAQAASRLAQTDWMVIRAAEGGTAVSDEVSTYRAAVRTASNTKESEIDALADIDAIAAYENKPHTLVTKVKHTDLDTGEETYGPETNDPETVLVNMVTGGWPTDPLAEVDPAFVSLTAV